MSNLTVPDSIKMLRETLSVAQNRIGNSPLDVGRRREHMDRLQRLIDDCERQRPTGPDGKHDDRHTPTCGCALASQPAPADPHPGHVPGKWACSEACFIAAGLLPAPAAPTGHRAVWDNDVPTGWCECGLPFHHKPAPAAEPSDG